jgi:hypothetical protein
MEWILLAQGRDQWRVLVNAVMSLLCTKSWGYQLPARFSKGHKSMGLSRCFEETKRAMCYSKYYQTGHFRCPLYVPSSLEMIILHLD